jgi:hypothetical protein
MTARKSPAKKKPPASARPRKKEPVAGRVRANDQPSVSLLDPRLHGWKVENVWPGLFTLYVRGSEARADCGPELQGILIRKQRGHRTEDDSAPKIEGALYMLAVGALAEDRSSFGWRDIEAMVYRNLVETLGRQALKVYSAQTESQAEIAATELLAVFKRAASGLVRVKFPQKAVGSGEVFAKEMIAIWHARMLCEHFRRLPSKQEVRERLELIGVTFSVRSKGVEGNWESLFDRAGLSGLP